MAALTKSDRLTNSNLACQVRTLSSSSSRSKIYITSCLSSHASGSAYFDVAVFDLARPEPPLVDLCRCTDLLLEVCVGRASREATLLIAVHSDLVPVNLIIRVSIVTDRI